MAMLCTLAVDLQPANGETLAVFECIERTGHDWHRTLVTYQVEFERGRVTSDTVRLVGADGNEVPCQFWQVKNHEDGSIASAHLSFYAELPKNGSYRFELQSGARNTGQPVEVEDDGVHLTLDNGLTAVRLPAGKRQFRQPLSMAIGEMPVPESYPAMEQAGIAFGPLAGVQLPDGSWVGGSYFATESIEAVRHRQGYIAKPPTDTERDAAANAAPKVVGYETEVAEHGVLFTDARIRFEFDNGGYYQLTARMLAGDAAVRIDEMMDIGGNCPHDHPLYIDFVASGGWKQDGWRPDALFLFAPRRKERFKPLEETLELHGFEVQYPSLPITYEEDHQVLTDVVPWDPYAARAHYFGIVDVRQLRASKSAPLVAVVPQHAGSWRAERRCSRARTGCRTKPMLRRRTACWPCVGRFARSPIRRTSCTPASSTKISA